MSTEVTADAVVSFAGGIPGFESCQQFVIMSGTGVEPFAIVRGLGPGAPSFAAIDPLNVVGGYRADLTASDLERLRADDDTSLLWLALISVDASGAATVNLRAPLVINPATLRGIQLIATDSTYSSVHPLRAA